MAIDFTNVNNSPVRHLITSFTGLEIASSKDFSVLVFARFNPGSGSFWYFLSTGPASGSNINMWRQADGNGRLSVLIGGAVTEVSGGPDQFINSDEWFLATFSRSDGVTSARLCKMGSGRVDASIAISNSAAYSASAASLLLGCRQDLDNLREWHGQMSDVIVCHDYGITAEEAIAAANGSTLEDLPLWNYRKFHADMSFDPAASSGFTDLTGGRVITRNNSGWGAKTDEPPLLRRYRQRDAKFFLFDFSAGSQIDLSADAAAQAAAAGELSTQIQVTGASVVVATANGAISTSIDLNGAAVSASIAAADITTGISLAANATGQSTATGALQSDTPELAGDAAGQATATADLTTTIALSGAAIAQAIAAAGIDTSILLAGGASGQSDAAGDLGGAAQLSGNAAGSATTTGDLTIQIQLSGVAVAQALAAGSLDGGPVNLAGNAVGQSAATGDLTTQIQLDADAAAVATATGQFTASDVPLAGNATAIATGAGDLNTQINLTGAALNLISSTGDLTVFLGISGHAAALVAAGADITTQILFNAAAVAQALAAANLTGGVSTIKPNPAYTVRGLWRDYNVAA